MTLREKMTDAVAMVLSPMESRSVAAACVEAALKVMRDPTEGMKGYAHHRLPDISRGQAHDVWQLMVDEAKRE